MHTRTILHVDVDCFLASVEQRLHPEWRGRPVCVGGAADDRSVVASASPEAKSVGVRTAMTLAQARARCPDAIFTRGYFPHYKAASDAILAIIADVSPDHEVVSLDDVYVDLTGFDRLYGHPMGAAHRLKLRIHDETGLHVSIGVATSKLVARMATSVAKPNGIVHVRPGYERVFLRGMAVDRLPGVGPATRSTLEKFNIHSIGELARVPQAVMEATFGEHGLHLARRARGEDDDVVATQELPKSISRETTFEQDTADRGIVEGMLYYLLERACRKLRGLGAKAKTLHVKVRYADFDSRAASESLSAATDQDGDFYEVGVRLLAKLLTRRMRIRLVGVALSQLRAEHTHQGQLFAERDLAKMRRLYRGIDAIRDRFGFSAITVGRSIDLLPGFEQDPHGFRLRTSCLTQ